MLCLVKKKNNKENEIPIVDFFGSYIPKESHTKKVNIYINNTLFQKEKKKKKRKKKKKKGKEKKITEKKKGRVEREKKRLAGFEPQTSLQTSHFKHFTNIFQAS